VPGHLLGNQPPDSNGKVFVPHGVNRSGVEFTCVQGKGVFDGPVDDASVSAITAWKADIVRVPLNEACWLGAPNVPSQSGGAAYQSAIESFVSTQHKHGPAVILDLHWTDGSTARPAWSTGPQDTNRGWGRDVLILGGVAYSSDLSQWLQHKPSDPRNNLVAS
jgi:hypothetical protein